MVAKESFLLNISTTGLENVNGRTHDFTFRTQLLTLDPDKEYKIGLLSYSLWYAWFNVSAEIGNNKFYYNNGSLNRVLTIPDGQYGISALNSQIKVLITAVGDNSDNIKIEGNYNTLKVEITQLNGYVVQFPSTNSLYRILGFYVNQTLVAGLNSSPIQPDITLGVDALSINCSILDSRYNITNNSTSTSLILLNVNTTPGSNISQTIPSPTYLPVSVSGHINNIHFTITSQDGTALNLNGENVSLSLHIQEQ
jgi:hypothetical protein